MNQLKSGGIDFITAKIINNDKREKFDYNKMASAMSKVQIQTTTRYDSFRAKNRSANHGSYQSDARHQTRFA